MRVLHDEPSLTPSIDGQHNALDQPADSVPPPAEVSIDEPIRQSLDTTVDLLTQEVERHLRSLHDAWQQHAMLSQASAVDLARRAFETDLERRVSEAVAEATAEQANAHRQTLLDVAQRAHDEVVRAWAEADEAIETARREAERRLVAQVAASERLLAGIQRLDRCTSLKETLDVLAERVALETTRCLVLVVRGQELRGWRLHGFGEDVAPGSLSVPLADAGALAQAVTTGIPVPIAGDGQTDAASASPAVPWLNAQANGLAVPVALGPHTVAVVYADEGTEAGPAMSSGWREATQILARHASRGLEALTAMRTAGLSPGGGAANGWRNGEAVAIEARPGVDPPEHGSGTTEDGLALPA